MGGRERTFLDISIQMDTLGGHVFSVHLTQDSSQARDISRAQRLLARLELEP